MYKRHELGVEGENVVEKFLRENKYTILERNYFCKLGEIDIIALDSDEIVFIEVKTRSQALYGSPAEAVNTMKKTHIYRVAEYYVMKNQLEGRKMRFDVVEVRENKNDMVISIIRNAILDKPGRCS